MTFTGFLDISPVEYGDTKAFSLTYSSSRSYPAGTIVSVPLGRRQSLGIVVKEAPAPDFKTRLATETGLPTLPPHLVELANWLHEYYLASPHSIWQTILPAGLDKNRRALKDSHSVGLELPKQTHALTPSQKEAVDIIQSSPKTTHLLRGVTGAGKTRVYLELTQKILSDGKSVIVLVPEISLTPQLVAHFENTFGPMVIPYHSGLTEARKQAAWNKALLADGPRIVIGPRSALFLPLKEIGLIIIDESHESAYKQEQAPRYQADITAGKLAAITGAKLVLGSATPSLLQVVMAQSGRIGHTEMTVRANDLAMPQTQIIDLRDKTLRGKSSLLSKPLQAALAETLETGRQSLLFINRRGSASSLLCQDCGHVFTCPHCELPLTFHADIMQLLCHICGFSKQPAAVCPDCGSTSLRYIGGGTKRVESEVQRLFPEARVARLDKDSATPKNIEEIHKKLHAGELDILIGTQMIAKGLDLPRIDTVGIISADTMLHLPDYSASERTFQLITQVSGRTGRGDRPGKVLLQTYTPAHPAIQLAASQDFWAFTESELPHREAMRYPPYIHLLKLTYGAKDAPTAAAKAEAVAQSLRRLPGLKVIGPAPAFRERERGKAYWNILVKSSSRKKLVAAAQSVPADWTIDLDPLNLL